MRKTCIFLRNQCFSQHTYESVNSPHSIAFHTFTHLHHKMVSEWCHLQTLARACSRCLLIRAISAIACVASGCAYVSVVFGFSCPIIACVFGSDTPSLSILLQNVCRNICGVMRGSSFSGCSALYFVTAFFSGTSRLQATTGFPCRVSIRNPPHWSIIGDTFCSPARESYCAGFH